MTRKEKALQVVTWWESQSTIEDRMNAVKKLGWETAKIRQDGYVSNTEDGSFTLKNSIKLWNHVCAPILWRDVMVLWRLNSIRFPLGWIHSLCLTLACTWPGSLFSLWEQWLCGYYNYLFGKDGTTQYIQHYQYCAYYKFRNLWSAVCDFFT